jgi:micrococcal nuclease
MLIAAVLPLHRVRAESGDTAGGVVERVIDGDTIMLQGGDEVRLAGILAPKPWQLRPDAGRTAAALPVRATQELGEIVRGRRVTLEFEERRSDRNGRALAQVQTDDGLWVQGEMLTRGLARVYTLPDSRARAPEMLALETQARRARRGLWAAAEFRIVDATETPRLVGSFQIVEGQVRDVRRGREQTYVHFGADRRADLTLTIAYADLRRFRGGVRDPASFAGRRLRVRGWLKSFDGPVIEATHPEQIELLA